MGIEFGTKARISEPFSNISPNTGNIFSIKTLLKCSIYSAQIHIYHTQLYVIFKKKIRQLSLVCHFDIFCQTDSE